MDARTVRRGMARGGAVAAVLAFALAGLFLATTRLSIGGRWRGLYLLRHGAWSRLELTDDLLLGDGGRLVAGASFAPARRWLGLEGVGATAPGGTSLQVEWDARDGRGLVRNRLADGTELVTMLGRYRDSQGGSPQGLFVGGAVPDVSADAGRQDQSGMAWRNARGWFHVWCNENEAWLDERAGGRPVWPSTWRFLGSRVLVDDGTRAVLESNHEVEVTGGRLRMDRIAAFTAGERFFQLSVVVTALGPQDVSYAWLYGDEPWVGWFGSADGNVGWVEGAVLPFEQPIDPATHRWAGILDRKTGIANYLGWGGGEPPDDAYVSNFVGRVSQAEARVPLTSNEVFLGLQWRGRHHAPGQSRQYHLTIGLADTDPATGRPRRPFGAPE